MPLHRMTADNGFVYAELLDAATFATRLVKVEQETGTMSVLVERLRDDHDSAQLDEQLPEEVQREP